MLYQQVIKSSMNIDSSLVTLLDLHGSVLDQGGGYWIKIDAWAVEVSDEMPQGVPYEFKDVQ